MIGAGACGTGGIHFLPVPTDTHSLNHTACGSGAPRKCIKKTAAPVFRSVGFGQKGVGKLFGTDDGFVRKAEY